jgi:hypothetical protein
MDGSTIAILALISPGVAAMPAIAALWHRSDRQWAAERAVFRELSAAPATPPSTPVPPTPGVPSTADTYTAYLDQQPATPATAPPAPVPVPEDAGELAAVIDLAARRRAA